MVAPLQEKGLSMTLKAARAPGTAIRQLAGIGSTDDYLVGPLGDGVVGGPRHKAQGALAADHKALDDLDRVADWEVHQGIERVPADPVIDQPMNFTIQRMKASRRQTQSLISL